MGRKRYLALMLSLRRAGAFGSENVAAEIVVPLVKEEDASIFRDILILCAEWLGGILIGVLVWLML